MAVIVMRYHLFESCMQISHFPNRKKQANQKNPHRKYRSSGEKANRTKYRLKHIAPDAGLGRQ